MSKFFKKIRNNRIIKNINRVLCLVLPFYANKANFDFRRSEDKLSETQDFVEGGTLKTNSNSRILQTGPDILQDNNTRRQQVSTNNHEIRVERVDLQQDFESLLEFESFRSHKSTTITILTGSGDIITNDERPLSSILKDIKSRAHISPTDLRRLNDNFSDF